MGLPFTTRGSTCFSARVYPIEKRQKIYVYFSGRHIGQPLRKIGHPQGFKPRIARIAQIILGQHEITQMTRILQVAVPLRLQGDLVLSTWI